MTCKITAALIFRVSHRISDRRVLSGGWRCFTAPVGDDTAYNADGYFQVIPYALTQEVWLCYNRGMDSATLTAAIKDEARRIGFAKVGVCPAVTPAGLHHFHDWLDAGYAGKMRYLPDRREAYAHPRHVLDGVRSLVMLATPYPAVKPARTVSGQGQASCYAWGQTDYHDVIHDRLKRLVAWLTNLVPKARARGVVDTAPLLEREFAQLAGLGWVGKNTMLIDREIGSWFFLAAMLTDVELEYNVSHEADHCGTCTACLDACPTGAFPRPYVLDATRCISYQTIESREAVPAELRKGLGDWIFGCDVCQEVCPWNSHVPVSEDQNLTPRDDMNPVDLIALFDLDDASFRERFRKTPLWRTKRRGLLRNAAIVLGNQRAKEAIPALTRGLHDEEALVRETCGWALEQIAACDLEEQTELRC